MAIDIVAPGWVYDLNDYRQMFSLSDTDLQKSILEFPGGIDAVNAQMHLQGTNIISADNFYSLSTTQLQTYVSDVINLNRQHLQHNVNNLLAGHSGLQEVFQDWDKRAKQFIEDYADGLQQGRYLAVKYGQLPFESHQFDLALCSDLVFRADASDKLTTNLIISELCRVAKEVRIFPLLDAQGEVAQDLGPLMLQLQQHNFGLEVKEVAYEQLKEGNAMLRIWATECKVE